MGPNRHNGKVQGAPGDWVDWGDPTVREDAKVAELSYRMEVVNGIIRRSIRGGCDIWCFMGTIIGRS